MKKTILLLCMALWMSVSATAQGGDPRTTINQIKKSKAFLYGEATMLDKDAAYELANEILQQEIETWAKDHSKKEADRVVAVDVHQLVDSIVLPRVNMIRVFLYVRKKNLIPIYEKAGVVIVDKEADEPSPTLTQGITSPTPSQEKEDQSPDSIAQDSLHSEGLGEVAPTKETGEVAPSEETGEPVPSQEQGVATEEADSLDYAVTETEQLVLEQVKPLKSFFRIRDVLVPLKEQGMVEDYGKYSSLEHPERAYLIIYDANARVRAVLGKGKNKRCNMLTNATESMDDYRGCGAIWFICTDSNTKSK